MKKVTIIKMAKSLFGALVGKLKSMANYTPDIFYHFLSDFKALKAVLHSKSVCSKINIFPSLSIFIEIFTYAFLLGNHFVTLMSNHQLIQR